MKNSQQNQCYYPSQKLTALINSKKLNVDLAQALVAAKLDFLLDSLCAAKKSRYYLPANVESFLERIGLWKAAPVKGFYIYGGVGRGKTMLMDMFHESVNASNLSRTSLPVIWRLHFHDFMVLAQDVIHEARKDGAEDPIESAAANLAQRGMVICFDEMEVRDIADAMILARLFSGMLERGTVLVVTSNRHANELYKDGLHRDRFLPFIDLLNARCEMCKLDDGIDWRGDVLADLPAWHTPQENGYKHLEAAFRQLAGDIKFVAETVRVAGRDIIVEKTAGDIGFFSFASLCDVPLGARDYLAIAGRFAGVVLAGVPQFTDENEHVARRFMWLIDALYDRGRFLIASADVEIANLYQGRQWKFEFSRTASRLSEMAQRGRCKNGI